MGILVTGSNGQMGRELRRIAANSSLQGWTFSDVSELPGEETVSLDITDTQAVNVLTDDLRPSFIINCAGYTDVEKAESEPEAARRLNAEAPRMLAAAAARTGACLVHISTDFVFPGDGIMPLKEDDPTGPVNVYGATKLEGEKAVLESGCRALVIRTAWMYSPYGRNFVKTMLSLFERRDSLSVVDDQTGSPTYAADLAAFIVSLAQGPSLPVEGLLHYAGDCAVSRFDFARAIRDISGSSCELVPCSSGDYPSKARRPACAALDCTRYKEFFKTGLPSWRSSLADCISRLG